MAELLEPLERSINEVLISAVTGHTFTLKLRATSLLSLCAWEALNETSSSEYEASIKVTNPLVRRVVEQEHQPPDASEIRTLQLSTGKQKDDCLSERLEQVNSSQPSKAKRAVELATEKGSSNWLTVIPLKVLDYNLNKKEFRDAIRILLTLLRLS